MSRHDRDWHASRPSFLRDEDNTLVWKIAAGVAIGIIVAVLAIYVIERLRMQAALDEAAKVFQGITRGVQESNAVAAAEARRREAARLAAEQDARLNQAAQQRALEDAKRAALEEAARKERAWARFYKRPASCDNNPTPEHMVDCANQHIRAKRQFEDAYAAGKL